MIYRICLLSTLLSTMGLFAEEPEKTVPITQIVSDGGWPMIILGFLSLIAVFLVVYYLCTLRMNVILPRDFQIEAEEIADQGDLEALHNLCIENMSTGGEIIGSAAQLLKNNPNAEYTAIRDVIEDEGSRHSNALWQRIQYLMDIAVVAPMVGLLGTVLGMIEAFVGLQTDFGSVKPIALAGGVSKALITTAGGLILGIICMLLYSYFRGHVSKLITELEGQCGNILHRFIFTSNNNGKQGDQSVVSGEQTT